MTVYAPTLTLTETGDRVRLSLAGLATAEGATLQEAGNDLWRVGHVAATGGDIRALIFG